MTKTIEKLEHIGKKKYYNICNVQSSDLSLIFNIDSLKD